MPQNAQSSVRKRLNNKLHTGCKIPNVKKKKYREFRSYTFDIKATLAVKINYRI